MGFVSDILISAYGNGKDVFGHNLFDNVPNKKYLIV